MNTSYLDQRGKKKTYEPGKTGIVFGEVFWWGCPISGVALYFGQYNTFSSSSRWCDFKKSEEEHNEKRALSASVDLALLSRRVPLHCSLSPLLRGRRFSSATQVSLRQPEPQLNVLCAWGCAEKRRQVGIMQMCFLIMLWSPWRGAWHQGVPGCSREAWRQLHALAHWTPSTCTKNKRWYNICVALKKNI